MLIWFAIDYRPIINTRKKTAGAARYQPFINISEPSDCCAYMPSKFGKPIEILGT